MSDHDAKTKADGAESASTAGLESIAVRNRCQEQWEQWTPKKYEFVPKYSEVWDDSWNAAIEQAAALCDRMDDPDYHVAPAECAAAIRLLRSNVELRGAEPASSAERPS